MEMYSISTKICPKTIIYSFSIKIKHKTVFIVLLIVLLL